MDSYGKVRRFNFFFQILKRFEISRIIPPVSMGYMVRAGGPNPPELAEMVSELGVFGVVIG